MVSGLVYVFMYTGDGKNRSSLCPGESWRRIPAWWVGVEFWTISVQVTWSPLPITILELRAICLAMLHWLVQLKGLHVKVQSDNATVVANRKHQKLPSPTDSEGMGSSQEVLKTSANRGEPQMWIFWCQGSMWGWTDSVSGISKHLWWNAL